MERRLLERLRNEGVDAAFLDNKAPEELYKLHEEEKKRLLKRLLDPKRESVNESVRSAYQNLCRRDKLYIYATWDWNQTVLDALRSAGFTGFEEYEALRRKKECAPLQVKPEKAAAAK
jgi:pyruvate,water dikinase